MSGAPNPSAADHERAPDVRLPSDRALQVAEPLDMSDVAAPVVVGSMRDLQLWRRVVIFLLILASEFLYSWAWNTVDVLRPFLRSSLNLSLLQAGSLYSAQGAGALVGALVMGQLADRIGRKTVLSLLVAGYGVLLIAGAFVTDYRQVLIQRFLLGIFMGGVFPVAVGIYVGLFRDNLRGRIASAMNALFSLSIVLLGAAVRLAEHADWRVLLWIGGLPALVVAPLVYVLIPSEGRVASAAGARARHFPIREMFAKDLRGRTLLLASMTGLNFFSYQAFSGWLTTFLTTDRAFSPSSAGALIAWQFSGNILGGFFWGWAGDRFGRRFNAAGFVLAALAAGLFLVVPNDPRLLTIIGFIYGGSICASVIWGPWLAELYPAHLRSTAASIFNWGRVISFFAPLITAALASRFGLRAAMASACLTFLAATVIWLSQPETLRRALSK